jgi:limonene 1,2-monooxygenase
MRHRARAGPGNSAPFLTREGILNMRFGVFIAPVHPMGENPTLQIRRDLELVDHVDRLGFKEAWYGEHHSGGLEIVACPELMIAAAAERTKRVRLGTGVCTLPYHNPFLLADRIVQLDHQTMGRLIFGVGAGALAYDAHMIGVDHESIRSRVEQSLSVISRLFAGESVTEKTDWYDLRDAKLQLLPYQSSIELALTAVNTAAGPRTAGQFGAGLLSIAATTTKGFEALPSTWETCAFAAAAAGKSVSRESWRLVGPVHIAETREAARRNVRFGLQEWLNYFTKVGTLPLAVNGDGDIDSEIDYLIETGLAVIGTPDDMVAQLERLQKHSGGFGCFLDMAHDWADVAETRRSYELIARYVVPRFNNQLGPRQQANSWAKSKHTEFAELRRQAAANVSAAPGNAAASAGKR